MGLSQVRYWPFPHLNYLQAYTMALAILYNHETTDFVEIFFAPSHCGNCALCASRTSGLCPEDLEYLPKFECPRGVDRIPCQVSKCPCYSKEATLLGSKIFPSPWLYVLMNGVLC
jgi:hypothetical protein